MASSAVLPDFSTGDSSTLTTNTISIPCQRRGLSSLPSEVHSQIASHFQGNFRMLFTICLLSRYWRDVSRRYLFSEVEIYNGHRLNTFLALLKYEPRLGGWVECLTLSSVHPQRNGRPEYSSWFYKFPDMRGKLPTLRTLILNLPLELDTLYTRQVFERLATSFGDSVVTVSFNTLLIHFRDLIYFTCRLPHLKSLVILGGQAVTFTKEILNPLIKRRVSSPQFRLDFLKISCAPSVRVDLDVFMAWLSSAPLIKTIRILEIRALWSTHDISSCSSTIRKVLAAIGPALEFLRLNIGIPNASGRASQFVGFNLQHNTRLRILSLDSYIPRAVFNILHTLPRGPSVTPRSIYMTIPFSLFADPHLLCALLGIDKLLAQEIGVADILHVKFLLPCEQEKLLGFVKMSFPLLHPQSRVKVVYALQSAPSVTIAV